MFSSRGKKPATGRRRGKRSGLTLIEILIVLGVLVAVAAMAMPALSGVWENQRLRDSGELLKAQWGRARVRAMKTGRIYVFQYTLDSGDFVIEPWYSEDEDVQSIDDPLGMPPSQTSDSLAPSASEDQDTGGGNFMGSIAGVGGGPSRLPEDIVFVSCRTNLDTRGLAVEQALGGAAPSGGSSAGGAAAGGGAEAQPVMFYPDGTTSTAELVLGNSRERFLVLSMRGLTGVVRSSDLLTADELPQ